MSEPEFNTVSMYTSPDNALVIKRSKTRSFLRKITNPSIFGIRVSFHWTMLILPLMWLLQGYGLGQSLSLFVVVFTSVLLHEFGHVAASNVLGSSCSQITLHLFGGVAMSRGDIKPSRRLVVYLCGPAVSLALLVTSFILFMSPSTSYYQLGQLYYSNFYYYVVGMTAIINFMLFVFNMLPMYPLDGGGALLSLLSIKLPVSKARRITGVVGLTTAGLIGMYFLSRGQIMGLCIVVFAVLANLSLLRDQNA